MAKKPSERIKDQELAQELVLRLNELIEHDFLDGRVRELLHALCERRIPVDGELAERHPTIQATDEGVGLLGILNGICGVRDNDFGYIAGVYDDEGALLYFHSTMGREKDR
jgi:hypothetical protein